VYGFSANASWTEATPTTIVDPTTTGDEKRSVSGASSTTVLQSCLPVARSSATTVPVPVLTKTLRPAIVGEELICSKYPGPVMCVTHRTAPELTSTA
jgi:hypothetical protein